VAAFCFTRVPLTTRRKKMSSRGGFLRVSPLSHMNRQKIDAGITKKRKPNLRKEKPCKLNNQ
jgi:hypothetical protein